MPKTIQYPLVASIALFALFAVTPAAGADFGGIDENLAVPIFFLNTMKGAKEAADWYAVSKSEFRNQFPNLDWRTDYKAQLPSDMRQIVEQLEKCLDVVTRARNAAYCALFLSDAEARLSALATMDHTDLPSEIGEDLNLYVASLEEYARGLSAYRNTIQNTIASQNGAENAVPEAAAIWIFLTPAMVRGDVGITGYSYSPERGHSFAYRLEDEDVVVFAPREELGKRLKIRCLGYTFQTDWTAEIYREIRDTLYLAREMRRAQVEKERDWRSMRTHTGLLADQVSERRVFYRGELLEMRRFGNGEKKRAMFAAFSAAARRLHTAIAANQSIDPTILRALEPVLAGTYGRVDARNQFDSAFCRRLVESGYLETLLTPFPPELTEHLAAFRLTLETMEDGYDAWTVNLPDGATLTCVEQGEPDTAENGAIISGADLYRRRRPTYCWRSDAGGETTFSEPMPGLFDTSLFILDRYSGSHASRPEATPDRTEVWHPKFGRLAIHRAGGERLEFNADEWAAATASDLGENAWLVPPHAVVRNGQGDTFLIALPGGVVPMPIFPSADLVEREKEKAEWLDTAATVMSSPEELGLLFTHMFQYVFDSPKADLPGLVGLFDYSADTHQTVDQTLDRLLAGRLVGDCDDLAEFYHNLTRRQGKISYMLMVGPPLHAVTGYLEKNGNGGYRFVVLQSGPPCRFSAPTAGEAVEAAYRRFNPSGGAEAERTAFGVAVMLRFGDEAVRGTFGLPRAIFEDDELGQALLRVQAFWRENTLSLAERAMEDLFRLRGRTVECLREMASIQSQVGRYDRALSLLEEEYDLAGDDTFGQMLALYSMLEVNIANDDREAARAVGERMEARLRFLGENGGTAELERLLAFTNSWAGCMAYLDQPFRTWEAYQPSVALFAAKHRRVSEETMTAMVALYEAMRAIGERRNLDADEAAALTSLETSVVACFASNYFLAGDGPDEARARYVLLGRFAIAREGRQTGLRLLEVDDLAATDEMSRARSASDVTEEDWRRFRATPELYYHFFGEMIDAKRLPGKYDPAAARKMLGLARRALDHNTSAAFMPELLALAEAMLCVAGNDLDGFSAGLARLPAVGYTPILDAGARAFGAAMEHIDPTRAAEWLREFRKAFPEDRHCLAAIYGALQRKAHAQALAMCDSAREFFPSHSLALQEIERIIFALQSEKK